MFSKVAGACLSLSFAILATDSLPSGIIIICFWIYQPQPKRLRWSASSNEPYLLHHALYLFSYCQRRALACLMLRYVLEACSDPILSQIPVKLFRQAHACFSSLYALSFSFSVQPNCTLPWSDDRLGNFLCSSLPVHTGLLFCSWSNPCPYSVWTIRVTRTSSPIRKPLFVSPVLCPDLAALHQSTRSVCGRPNFIAGLHLVVTSVLRFAFLLSTEWHQYLQELLSRPRLAPFDITLKFPARLLRGLPSRWSTSFPSPFRTRPFVINLRLAAFLAALSCFALREPWYLRYSIA